jgi:GTP cyclohydrolase I
MSMHPDDFALPLERSLERPSKFDALAAMRTILRYIGEDPLRPGLLETPDRVLRAWEREWGRGYREDPSKFARLFEEEQPFYDSMVIVRHIRVRSMCEHHMAPFIGYAHVGYLPKDARHVVGISKLARIVDHFSRRLQVQERLTYEIVDFIMDKITDLGAGVIICAKHTCMCTRGVNEAEAETVTSALKGAFFDNPETRSEFLRLAHPK